MPLNAMTRSLRTGAPVSIPHIMPAHWNRWVRTVLQAASVTPLPIGTRSRWRSASFIQGECRRRSLYADSSSDGSPAKPRIARSGPALRKTRNTLALLLFESAKICPRIRGNASRVSLLLPLPLLLLLLQKTQNVG